MKKAALTIGLFSSIMVATSFATPEKTNKSIAGNIDIMIGTDGTGSQRGNDRRKTDEYRKSNESDLSYNQVKGFDAVSQSMRTDKKID
ncbi:hypothetical protein [Flavobacterium sp. JAS]|uniref:hypothetical protein n=1 Tax=Flavobacterium sp. JAS TaxID=2897329 RepID=UPI001E4B91ED|nr:hypothetical protein [Flavobacterium sp. JAS]MCD0470052.1 hypothetical protein [Flavobacterium sp. JAS]